MITVLPLSPTRVRDVVEVIANSDSTLTERNRLLLLESANLQDIIDEARIGDASAKTFVESLIPLLQGRGVRDGKHGLVQFLEHFQSEHLQGHVDTPQYQLIKDILDLPLVEISEHDFQQRQYQRGAIGKWTFTSEQIQTDTNNVRFVDGSLIRGSYATIRNPMDDAALRGLVQKWLTHVHWYAWQPDFTAETIARHLQFYYYPLMVAELQGRATWNAVVAIPEEEWVTCPVCKGEQQVDAPSPAPAQITTVGASEPVPPALVAPVTAVASPATDTTPQVPPPTLSTQKPKGSNSKPPVPTPTEKPKTPIVRREEALRRKTEQEFPDDRRRGGGYITFESAIKVTCPNCGGTGQIRATIERDHSKNGVVETETRQLIDSRDSVQFQWHLQETIHTLPATPEFTPVTPSESKVMVPRIEESQTLIERVKSDNEKALLQLAQQAAAGQGEVRSIQLMGSDIIHWMLYPLLKPVYFGYVGHGAQTLVFQIDAESGKIAVVVPQGTPLKPRNNKPDTPRLLSSETRVSTLEDNDPRLPDLSGIGTVLGFIAIMVILVLFFYFFIGPMLSLRF